jgi:hypothetical protein
VLTDNGRMQRASEGATIWASVSADYAAFRTCLGKAITPDQRRPRSQ